MRRIRAGRLAVVVASRGIGARLLAVALTLRRIRAGWLAVVVASRGIGARLLAVALALRRIQAGWLAVAVDVAQDPGGLVGCRS